MDVRKVSVGAPLATILIASAIVPFAAAQEISLNYERLSSLEEPIATEVGDVTIALTGLLDTRLSVRSQDTDAADAIGNAELRASTQWPGRLRVGVAYFGQYATIEGDDAYEDNAAVSLGGAWGTALAGDVSGVVREQTRRLRGAGNGFLAFDDFLGERESRAGGYVGRFGPWVASAVVDADGNVDAGAMFQRPSGDKDWRFTFRAAEGRYRAADRSVRLDSEGVGVVGELVHGSTTLDAGVGLERLTSPAVEVGRWYVSAGVHTKIGVVSMSLGGHYGRIESEEEVSAAFGLQYDIARGLSANLGLNHARAKVAQSGIALVDTRDTEAVLSLRYSF